MTTPGHTTHGKCNLDHCRRTEGIAREMRDSTQESVRGLGNSVSEEGASLDGGRKPDLIGATIGRDTIGNEAALQLSMPVWQCNAESLIQTGV
jgi:hypothetical protein